MYLEASHAILFLGPASKAGGYAPLTSQTGGQLHSLNLHGSPSGTTWVASGGAARQGLLRRISCNELVTSMTGSSTCSAREPH